MLSKARSAANAKTLPNSQIKCAKLPAHRAFRCGFKRRIGPVVSLLLLGLSGLGSSVISVVLREGGRFPACRDPEYISKRGVFHLGFLL